MKITLKINNQDIEAEIKDSDVANIVKPKKKLRPEINEWYFYASTDGRIETSRWSNDVIDNGRWSSGNGFFTEKEAKKELDKRQAIQRIKNYIIEHDMEFCPDWNNMEQEKHYPFFKYDLRLICWGRADHDYYDYYLPFGYLASEEHLKQLTKDCQDDLLIIFDKK